MGRLVRLPTTGDVITPQYPYLIRPHLQQLEDDAAADGLEEDLFLACEKGDLVLLEGVLQDFKVI